MILLKRYCAVLLFIALAYACTKGNDEAISNGPTGSLNVINAVTDVRAINVYLNGTRQNVNSTIFINNTSGYLTVPAAEQQYQVKEDTTRQQIASVAIKLPKDSTQYSLLLTGQKGGNTITSILMDDTDTTSLNNNSRIRFVQGSPGTATYDVYVGDVVSFKAQAFKAVSKFTAITGGVKTIRIMPAGSTTAIYTTNITLVAGSFYTLFTEGVAGGSGTNALSIGLVTTR